MQIRQQNQGFNFDQYPTFKEDIDPKQRAWIEVKGKALEANVCLLYTSPSPRDRQKSRMPSSA